MNTISHIKIQLVRLLLIPVLTGMALLTATVLKAAPVAAFSANVTSGCSPLSVQFISTSTGAVSYYWDLGNGNTSTLANPINLYTIPGYYTISLAVTDASGQSDSVVQVGFIQVIDNPVSDFSSSVTSACLDDNLFSFTNASTGASSYLWDFGDGTTSAQVNPVHHYNIAGTFTITLIATSTFGCEAVSIQNLYITVYPKPVASITAGITSSCDPATVFHFVANGTASSWQWSFGDGSTSSLPNPAHVYGAMGIFPVSLIETDNHGCKDTSDNPVTIHVGTTHWASFSSGPDSGCAPLSVTFRNTNSNAVSCFWQFGDGSTSTSGNPTHNYTSPGIYTVSLIVTTSTGCTDTVIMPNLITAGIEPIVHFSVSAVTGCAPFAVNFINTSSNYTSCLWDFGDGTSSNATNPSHSYTANGVYSVTLSCWGPTGCVTSLSRNGIVNVSSAHGLFSANPRIGCPPLTVQFSNASYGNHLSYHWNFGDGTTSTQAAPSHTYTTSGNFDVTLLVTDSLGCLDTVFKPSYIQTLNPAGNYIPPPTTTGCAPVTAQFTDATVGSMGWLWDFGDGTTSTLQNPIHGYVTPGFYTVSLITQTAGGGCTQAISNFSTFDVKGGYAGFTHTDSPCPPYQSVFTDTSLNAISWSWDFGDGSTSTLQNPSHTYADPGYHSTTLTITTVDGCTYTTMQNGSTFFPPFGANFYGSSTDTTFPMTVNFFANSLGATGWLWNFGDSTTSTLENPVHVYTVPAVYNVTLTITNGTCSLTYAPPPQNYGTPDTTAVSGGSSGQIEVRHGCAPLTVSFSNLVGGSVRWHWDFGDGDTSTTEFATHTYYAPGVYSVILTTYDSLGTASDFPMDSIVTVAGPKANFTFTKAASCNNTLIQLNDSSTGAVSSWFWNLGDGSSDTTMNVTHLYTSGMPNYIVTHTVIDTLGCSSSISTSIFANFVSPLLVSESEICGLDTVHFNTSLQNYAAYHWDFGDGDSSAVAAPVHLYTTEGSFSPSVTVTDSSGCSQTFSVFPPVSVSLPSAAFSISGTPHGCGSTRFDFINSSSNADSYHWDFGDGTSSTNHAPSHIYSQAGSYTVSLTIYRGNCVTSVVKPNYITIDTSHAAFSVAAAGICLPASETFTDLSANAVSWMWLLGNGDTSYVQNPTEVYTTRPTGTVKLYITDIHGCRDSAAHAPMSPLTANFNLQNDSGCAPFTAHFTDNSSLPYRWFWNFGDGDTSTLQSPVHTYTNPGSYDVMLIVSSSPNYNCVDTIIIPQLVKVKQPAAEFTTPDISACAPSVVNFTDLSIDADSYLWNFGDSTTSTNQDPSHIYTVPGIYSVQLIAKSSLGCSDTLLKSHYIYVLGSVTDFTPSIYSGCDTLLVNFSDLSQHAVNWSWNFGDGYASTQQSPMHAYGDTGSFTVALVTQDTAGCSSFYQLIEPITVFPTPVSSFVTQDTAGCEPYTVHFTNISVASDSSYWDFGDGTASTDSSPSHTYTVSGSYTVRLVAKNRYGCTSLFTSPNPIVVSAMPHPAFAADTAQGCAGLAVTFHNLSTNLDQPAYSWNFGNGDSSSLSDPTAQFMSPGFFTISLTVTNASGCSATLMQPTLIHVFDTLPPAISEILSVSVTSNSTVEIKWENNAAIDLGAYKLYRLNAVTNTYAPVYTINDPNNTGFALNPLYVDSGLNTLINTYTYKLVTSDMCGYEIGLDSLTPHTTINVSSQRSGQNIHVWWNAYSGCPVDNYEIRRSSPGTAPQLIATVPSTQLTFTDSTFDCPYTYSYRITATDLCARSQIISNSDTSSTAPFNSLANQVVDVVRSTVVDNETVLTEWLPPLVHPEKVASYQLYRSVDNTDFSYLTSVTSSQTEFIDRHVNVQQYHYYYKIKVVNTCDIDEDPSLNTSTVLLQGEMRDDRSVHLYWSPYVGWDTGVDYYIIEKKDTNGQWQFLKQVSGNTTEYDYQE